MTNNPSSNNQDPFQDNESIDMAPQATHPEMAFQKCLHKMVDYLSRRDHSSKELRDKLTKKGFEANNIQRALEWAKDRGYLRPPQELSQHLSEILSRKGKGRLYIEQYLKRRGLPLIENYDTDAEFEKALEFARQRAKKYAILDRSIREKIGRQLVTRGFPLNVVRKVIYEKLEHHEEF